MSERIKACLAVICQSQQVLLACRPVGKILAGYWEFPGGKLEAGEDCFSALGRELTEEIGITVALESMELLGNIEHRYSHGLVELAIIKVKHWSGIIRGCEQQQLIWYSATRIQAADSRDPANFDRAQLLPTTAAVLELLHARAKLNE